MTDRRISLTLVLHNHQPVGNFGFVFEDNYQTGLRAHARRPGATSRRAAGPALHRTAARLVQGRTSPRPSSACAALVERGQVEVLGGGYYEPVLASLREHDRVGPARRAWPTRSRRSSGSDPTAPGWPSASGSRTCPRPWPRPATSYTIVDDAHFRAAAIPRRAALGPLLDRRPGLSAARLRLRAGPALSHPLPAGRGGHRVPARARHRGRRRWSA